MAGAGVAVASVEEVAEACNLTRQRIAQLVKLNVLPKAARGVYDVDACLRAYVRYLQEAVQAKAVTTDAGELVTQKGARAELLTIQTAMARFELAKARSGVISVPDHESILSSLIIETKARVMAIAPRVAPKLLGMDSRLMVQATIEAEAKLALMELAARTPVFEPKTAGPIAPAPQATAKAKRAKKRPAKKVTAKRNRKAAAEGSP